MCVTTSKNVGRILEPLLVVSGILGGVLLLGSLGIQNENTSAIVSEVGLGLIGITGFLSLIVSQNRQRHAIETAIGSKITKCRMMNGGWKQVAYRVSVLGGKEYEVVLKRDGVINTEAIDPSAIKSRKD